MTSAVVDGDRDARQRFMEELSSAPDSSARAQLLDPLAAAAGSSEHALDLLLTAVITQELAAPAIRSLILGRDDVEEVAQDVLIAVSTSIDSFRGEARFTTWLSSLARNTAIAHLRRKRDAVSLDEAPPVSAGARLSSMIATRAALRSAVNALDPTYRDPLVLRDVEHLPYQTIADRLDLTLAATKSRIFRARALLAGRLDLEGFGDA